MKTVDLIDALRAQHTELTSDNKAALFLGVNPQRVHNYRTKGTVMDDELGVKLADELNIPREIVLTWLAAERTKCPAAKTALEHAAEMLRNTAAAVILLVCGLSAGLAPSPVSACSGPVCNIHYAQLGRARRSLLAWLSSLLLL